MNTQRHCLHKMVDDGGYRFYSHGKPAKWFVKGKWNGQTTDSLLPVCTIHKNMYEKRGYEVRPIEEASNA